VACATKTPAAIMISFAQRQAVVRLQSKIRFAAMSGARCKPRCVNRMAQGNSLASQQSASDNQQPFLERFF
jgi:hypothetical protein